MVFFFRRAIAGIGNLFCLNLNFRNVNTDIEPVYTFRKHTGSVLSVLISGDGDHLISSGLDSKIILWNMPQYETVDQYDPYCNYFY